MATEPCAPNPANVSARRGALIGSFWDQAWFDKTCDTLAGCDCEIDWFGNNQSPWLSFPEKSLERAGIRAHGVLPETELASRLRQYPFVLVPVGNLDDEETNQGVACLSMPGRILFALATSNTPVILLGSEKTCGARLVRHFGVGVVAPYSARRLSSAIQEILEPKNQKRFRESAVAVGRRFSDEGIVEWLETSMRIGAPADDR
ncbi:MAG: beta-1,6-galactofuranosyltransferase, partial [bacterium]|nr:beta-1,6-galactofuranosyltransferase [bacterium]